MSGRKVVKDKKTGELKLVPRKGPPGKDKIFRRLESSIPREELLQVMESAPDERAQQLFRFMSDPAFRKKSLPQLAKECGLSYPQVLDLIRRHHIEDGLIRMSKHAPKVMEDVAIDSRSKEVKCGQCKGTGEIVDGDTTEQCYVCDGTGLLRKVGDEASRKLLFETLKLTGRSGPLVVQQFNQGSQTMEETISGVRDVLDITVEKKDASSDPTDK